MPKHLNLLRRPLAALARGLLLAACVDRDRAGPEGRAPGAGAARRLRDRGCHPRIRRRRAGALRDRSRLPGRRQDGRRACQCRRPRACRRCRGAARSAGPEAAGRKRRGRARGGDLESHAGRGRSRALYHAARRAATRRSPTSIARRRRRTKPKGGSSAPSARSISRATNSTMPTFKADADGVITATLAEPGQVVAIGQAVVRLAHRGEKEAVVALPETWLAEARRSGASRAACGPIRIATSTPGCASCRRRPTQRPAPMRRALPSSRSRRHRRARHDGDGHALARGRGEGREAAARRQSSTAAPARRSMWSTQSGALEAAAGDGRVLHRGRGARHLGRRRRRQGRDAWRAEARGGAEGPQHRR